MQTQSRTVPSLAALQEGKYGVGLVVVSHRCLEARALLRCEVPVFYGHEEKQVDTVALLSRCIG